MSPGEDLLAGVIAFRSHHVGPGSIMITSRDPAASIP
jgi:hypothetical protein